MNVIKSFKYGQIIYNEKDTNYGHQINEFGEYCEFQSMLFKEIVKKDNWIIDLGANYGTHSVMFSWLVGEKGVIHAFEPNRHAYYCLCGTVAINNLSNVYCRQQQVGKESSYCTLSEFNQNHHQDFCFPSLVPGTNTYSVRVFKLDELKLNQCDLLKITCNLSREVIAGGPLTIAAYKPTIYVANTFDWPIRELHELGYKTYLHIPRLFNAHNMANNRTNTLGLKVQQHLLAVHPDREIDLNLEYFDLDEITDDTYVFVSESTTESLQTAQQNVAASLAALADVYEKRLGDPDSAKECVNFAEKHASTYFCR